MHINKKQKTRKKNNNIKNKTKTQVQYELCALNDEMLFDYDHFLYSLFVVMFRFALENLRCAIYLL